MVLVNRMAAGESGMIDSFESLINIKRTTEQMLQQRATQEDYFGHAYNYVPRVDYTFLKPELETLLKRLETVELSHTKYFDHSNKQEVCKNVFHSMVSEVHRELHTRTESIKNIESTITFSADVARVLQVKMTPAKEVLSKELERVQDQLEKLRKSLSIGAGDILEMLAMLAVSPDTFMIGMQVASLRIKAIGGAGVKDDKGNKISKELLVEEFKTIGASIETTFKEYKDQKEGTSE